MVAERLHAVSDWSQIYRQIQGTLMGSPVSVVISNLGPWEKSHRNSPPDMKPRIWKRYVDDWFEIVKDQRDQFTEHLNTIDHTGSITFTDEPDIEYSIPLLDVLSQEKMMVPSKWKPTQTGQYLKFKSHHPLKHKLGFFRTLYERSDIVTPRKPETVHTDQGLIQCGMVLQTGEREIRE